MASRTEVTTNTSLTNGMTSKSTTWSDGDSTIDKQVAGYTAGMVVDGHAKAHSEYYSAIAKPPSVDFRGR